MDFWQILVLGAVEGISEFLPISSTGHLILASRLLNISQTEYVKSFEIAVQLGAILAVLGMYAKKVLAQKKILTNVAAAFVPTGVIGFFGYKWVKQFLIGSTEVTLVALFAGGILLLIWEKTNKSGGKKIDEIGWREAGIIGLVQAGAMIPGVSRALATIIGGMTVGLSRKEAVEISFLLAVPTMAAATGLDLARAGWSYSPVQWAGLAVGTAAAYVAARVSVKWLVGYIERHDFRIFGYYRIVLAAGWWFIFR